jgi:hypothetical protein
MITAINDNVEVGLRVEVAGKKKPPGYCHYASSVQLSLQNVSRSWRASKFSETVIPKLPSRAIM